MLVPSTPTGPRRCRRAMLHIGPLWHARWVHWICPDQQLRIGRRRAADPRSTSWRSVRSTTSGPKRVALKTMRSELKKSPALMPPSAYLRFRRNGRSWSSCPFLMFCNLEVFWERTKASLCFHFGNESQTMTEITSQNNEESQNFDEESSAAPKLSWASLT